MEDIENERRATLGGSGVHIGAAEAQRLRSHFEREIKEVENKKVQLEQALEIKKIKNILEQSKAIAVVGLSPRPERSSHNVASYLQSQGYKIIPVNPKIKKVLGEKSYPNLSSIPYKIDVVDIFRRPEYVSSIVEEAINAEAKVIWMQEGVINELAAKRAQEAGLEVVMDKCMMKEHKKILI